MPKIIVNDSNPSHTAGIISGINIGYGSDISDEILIEQEPITVALAEAVSVGAIAVIRSTTGVNNYVDLAKSYYDSDLIQVFMPLGSNSFIELTALEEVPVIVTSGAGDEEERNNTAYGAGLEFWDWDLKQTETPSADASSFSNGVVLGKLLKIKDDLECSWWEARYRARMTCPRLEPNRENSPHDLHNGYGRIDIEAAKAYTGEIPEDPYYDPVVVEDPEDPPLEAANPPAIYCNQNYPNRVSGIYFIPEESSGTCRYKYDDEDWIEISTTTIPERILEKGNHVISVQEYYNDMWSDSATEQLEVGKMNFKSSIVSTVKAIQNMLISEDKFQAGDQCEANGSKSVAIGFRAKANGNYSVSIGYSNLGDHSAERTGEVNISDRHYLIIVANTWSTMTSSQLLPLVIGKAYTITIRVLAVDRNNNETASWFIEGSIIAIDATTVVWTESRNDFISNSVNFLDSQVEVEDYDSGGTPYLKTTLTGRDVGGDKKIYWKIIYDWIEY